MRKLACLFTLTLCGCASVGENVTVTSIYQPPVFGGLIGEVQRVEDKSKGVVIYYRVEKFGAVHLGTFMEPGSKLVPVAGK